MIKIQSENDNSFMILKDNECLICKRKFRTNYKHYTKTFGFFYHRVCFNCRDLYDFIKNIWNLSLELSKHAKRKRILLEDIKFAFIIYKSRLKINIIFNSNKINLKNINRTILRRIARSQGCFNVSIESLVKLKELIIDNFF